MKRIATIFTALALAGGMLLRPAPTHAQGVREEWVARYNESGNGLDYARDMALDHAGNVYVTGYSEIWAFGTGYATIKYDTAGNELWEARYHGPRHMNFARAIAIDASDNVYVTGSSMGAGTSFDYATVKYDAAGNELWVARYDGPGSDWDVALALALDESGNVYVTGGSYGAGPSNDYATIKYDGDGKEVWVARYNGPGNGSDFTNAIALDASGNVYITGSSWGGDTRYDYATIKYDPAGNELWAARHNGPGNDVDQARSLAVDIFGNVYVTGWSSGVGTFEDYATIKYDPAGNQLWLARYNGPANSEDLAIALAVDATGDVYVTGSSCGNRTFSDYATIKYNRVGEQVWLARYNGPGNKWDGAGILALDASGDVYVTGSSWGGDNYWDYATIKYDPAGNELWLARYNGPQMGGDRVSGMVLDASGDVYVTGTSWGGATRLDYATIKYSQPILGDLNCDGVIDALDIEPFLVALFEPESYGGQYPDCDINLADINGDGSKKSWPASRSATRTRSWPATAR